MSTSSETFVMYNYVDRIEAIWRKCFLTGLGYNGGVVWVGQQEKIFAYFGGVPVVGPGGANETV